MSRGAVEAVTGVLRVSPGVETQSVEPAALRAGAETGGKGRVEILPLRETGETPRLVIRESHKVVVAGRVQVAGAAN